MKKTIAIIALALVGACAHSSPYVTDPKDEPVVLHEVPAPSVPNGAPPPASRQLARPDKPGSPRR